MSKKILAAILVLANVLSLASCSMFTTPTFPEDDDPDETSAQSESTRDKIYDKIDKISKALADSDYERFKEFSEECRDLERAMPSISEKDKDKDNYMAPKVTDSWKVKHMIAETITYKIDDDSYKGGFWGSKCSVDVTFSYKDYHEVVGMREEFLGPADFNTLLYDVEKTIDTKINLIFTKVGDDYQLYNPAEFICLYNYENLETLKFMKNCFDMVKNVYMTGPGWDEATESYTDVNEFTIVFELDERAKNYVWTYIYRVSEELNPKWNHLYTSSRITVESPTEIRITYKQDEIFKTGYYCFIIYDPQSETLMGMEYDVYNTKDGSMPTTTESTTETTT